MRKLGLAILCSLGATMTNHSAIAADPWHQSFNNVGVSPNRNLIPAGGLSIRSNNIDGFAEFPEVSRNGGNIIARGSADFDSLKLYIEMNNRTADHRGTALSHSLYTISSPGLPPGSTGTMYLNYSFGGRAYIDGNSDNFVSYSLSVRQNIENNGIGGTLLGSRTAEIGGGGPLIVPNPAVPFVGSSTLSVLVPFVFDEEFRITTVFGLVLRSDQEYDFNSSTATYTLSNDSTFKSIRAEFDNSATLDAIYLPDGASITLNSTSAFDLSPLVQFGTPVPLPPAFLLLLPTLVALTKMRRRSALS